MAENKGPLLRWWEGVRGWHDPTRTSVTDNRTRVRRIVQKVAIDRSTPQPSASHGASDRVLRRRTSKIVRALFD